MKALNIINLAVGLVLITLLVLAGAYLQKLINVEPENHTVTVMLKTDRDCDLSKQACTAGLNSKTIKLTLQQPVRYLTKFQVQVQVDGFEQNEITKMVIDFTMPGMNMGVNRFGLQETQTSNSWQGMAILPVCVTGRLDWQATLFIATDKSNYTAIHNLTVEN